MLSSIKEVPELVVQDEAVFGAVHAVGLDCGLVGLGLTILTLTLDVDPRCFWYVLVPFGLFIGLPYALVLIYWIVQAKKKARGEKSDEKQKEDLIRAGLTSFLAAIPCMLALFGLSVWMPGGAASLMWFPCYLFVMLVLFSASTLYTTTELVSGNLPG